ncbi:MAG TPA: carboxypeptidase-like regulatory domain-containing protein, partial [Ferruginibacter sp.]|nr:carboxypeptidase-like regulatory domain-containing protein [Ferruginibacter sp.]
MLKTKLLLTVSMFLFSLIAVSQSKTITGKITLADKTALNGATVTLKNSTIATRTGTDGNYSITVPIATGKTLVISFVGYEPKEVSIGNATTIDVTLTEE